MNNYSILIADDEPIEYIALELLLKNNFPSIRVLPSVSNGIDLIASVKEHHPDIIIADINMPGLGGLDALDIIRSQNPEMKLIIHSAYNKFDYAKKALSLNAYDYMVKPVPKPAFIETIKKILDTLNKEQQKKTSEETIDHLTCEINRLMENDIMSSILLGTIERQTSELFLHSLKHEYCGGFLATVRYPGNTRTVWDLQKQEEIIASLNQVCPCLGKSWYQDLLLYLIPGPGIGENNYQQWCLHLFESLHIPLLVGISTWKFTLDELPDAQKESNIILMGRQDTGVYFFEYASYTHTQDIFADQKENLVNLLATNRIEECYQTISSLYEQACSLEVPLASVQIYTAYFILYLHREMARRFSFPLYELNHVPGFWAGLWNCSTCKELKETLTVAIHKLNDLIHHPMSKSWEYVAKAFIYMKKMYTQDIALDDIAQLVGISSFYLSRLLKQELNETFIELLTRIRIEEALILLQDPAMTIREIGQKVGYNNTTYFYKVFKKQTGMTVGEIRRNL